MERNFRGTNIVFILVFFVLCNTYAQVTHKQESLVQVIDSLQKQYRVQFNYAEDLVENVFVIPPSNDFSLTEVIFYLETKTGLTFLKMSETIVLIKPKELFFCGYVKDKSNMQSLAAATVQGVNSSTITDEKGYFQIKIETINEAFTVRFLGYETITMSFNEFINQECANIYLTPNLQSLPKVVISNYITSGINKISDGSYEINFSDFDILPGLIDNDVLQSVQAFPGIQSINETVSNINIRGGTHDQN